MKGTVDKLLNFMKLSDDEEYDEEYEEYEDDEEEEEEPRSTFSFFKKKEPEVEESSNSKISQPFDNTITASREAKKRRFTSTGSKVVSMNGRGVEVYVIKPQDFAEAQTAADLLKEGRTVVINLEGVELTVLILWAEQLMRSMDPYRQYQTIFLLQHQTVLKSAEI